MVEGQNHMAQEVELAFRTFDYVSRKAYNIRFHEVLSESNKRRRSSRVRQISGVVLKLNYSQERKILHPLTGRTEYRWRIDSDKLARKPDNDWELRILEAYPGRAPGETGKGVALRLKRETLLGRAFVQSLHSYVCKDADTRARVKQILKEGGLEEFAGLATPRGALKASVIWLVPHLSPFFGFYAAAGIVVAALVLATLGLDAICRSSSEPANRRKQRTKRNRVTNPT
jgi:hypothetical protein